MHTLRTIRVVEDGMSAVALGHVAIATGLADHPVAELALLGVGELDSNVPQPGRRLKRFLPAERA